jgi:hypothetical protein
MTAFLEAIYVENRSPLTLVVDEADMFAPQRPGKEQLTMLGRMEQICRRGRVRGFRPWLITQRPASLHKSVLSQANTLIAMQLTAPQDRDALGDWIEGQADRVEGKKVLAELPKLAKGEGFVWAPHENLLERVKFPAITTYDSSRTPEDGEQLPLVKLAEGRPVRDRRGAEEAGRGRRLRASATASRTASLAGTDQAPYAIRMPIDIQKAADIPPRSPHKIHTKGDKKGGNADLPRGEQQVLTAIAQHREGVTREQITVLTGYKRSTRDAYVQRLRERGLVDVGGDRIVATGDGLAALGPDFKPLPKGAALRKYWTERLPQGERRVFEVVANLWPRTSIETRSRPRPTSSARPGTPTCSAWPRASSSPPTAGPCARATRSSDERARRRGDEKRGRAHRLAERHVDARLQHRARADQRGRRRGLQLVRRNGRNEMSDALTHHHREWKQMYAALANRAVLSAALEGAKVERGGGWVKVHRLTPEAADMLVALVEPRSDGPEA